MSIDWFPFNIKDFLANTKRLNTEAKGAYLCLMLDYYENGSGPPDDDDVLAAICELPVDVWQRHRKVIAPLFKIEQCLWHHSRMDFEIADAIEKMRKANERGVAGATKRWGDPDSRPNRKKNGKSNAHALPEAKTEQSNKDAQLHSTVTPSQESSLSTLTREKIEVPEESATEVGGIGTPIDPDYTPPPDLIEVCHEDGATDAVIDAEIKKFVADKQESGGFSANWDASWVKWWARWREYRDKHAAKPRGKARIEVNSAPFEPNAVQWEKAVEMFAKGMRWPKAGYGPQPGDPGCRCPHAIISAAGLDPHTGMKIASGAGMSMESK